MFLCFFTVHLFEAYGRGNISLLLGVVRWAVFNIPLLLLLDRRFGEQGVIFTQVTADGLAALFSLAVFLLWRRKATLRPVQY
jgi:Na+-driven multidrug efflux pump